MRYVLNSAVITTEGLFSYRLITIEQAKEWLKQGEFTSVIGYEQTAKALSMLVDIPISTNYKQIRMQTGDEALVFRLTRRLDDPALKGTLSVDFILNNCEIGMLKKLRRKKGE